jgi:biotin carboxylase
VKLRTGVLLAAALAAIAAITRRMRHAPAGGPPEPGSLPPPQPAAPTEPAEPPQPAQPAEPEPPEVTDMPEGWSVVDYTRGVPDEPPRPAARRGRKDDGVLRGMAAIRRFFRTNETPVWFVSATAFNLLGVDRWVRSMGFVNYYDSFDGHHPRVFAPTHASPPAFESIEEICNYLLGHKEVVDRVKPGGGKALFLMFDEETERLAAEAGLEVAFPSAALRHRLDSKIVTTQLADEAGVPSVPNVLGRAGSWDELRALASGAGLGDALVVQTPYGDSGQTTFFVRTRDDWDAHAAELTGEDLKVMRRIEPREAAIEGVITRHGTLVGPLMTELTGFPELTPYGGGWCGNDVFATALTEDHRRLARRYTQQMGERLRQEGYRGYFELDFLADMGSGEMYLGELNPRVTGASSMTNVTAVAYGDMPLFLFHLLEFMDVEYEIDVDELNEGWAAPGAIDEWSQFILKDTADKVEVITKAPRSGLWRLDEAAHGGIKFKRRATDWHTIANEGEAFYLRIAHEGGYRYPGADIGILVTRGRLQTDDHELTDRARTWIDGIKRQFETSPLPTGEPAPVTEPEPFGFKLL